MANQNPGRDAAGELPCTVVVGLGGSGGRGRPACLVTACVLLYVATSFFFLRALVLSLPPPPAQERIQQLNTELKQTRAQLKAAQESYENAAERSRETVREQIEAVRRECRAVEEHCKLELDQMRRTAVCEEGRLLPLPLSPTPFHPPPHQLHLRTVVVVQPVRCMSCAVETGCCGAGISWLECAGRCVWACLACV